MAHRGNWMNGLYMPVQSYIDLINEFRRKLVKYLGPYAIGYGSIERRIIICHGFNYMDRDLIQTHHLAVFSKMWTASRDKIHGLFARDDKIRVNY